MAVRFTSIKKDKGYYENPYVSIRFFEWKNEQAPLVGVTDREAIYDWIKENRGQAYIENHNGEKKYLLPAISPQGNKYVKTVIDENEQDHLLSLPEYRSL
jgi:hypothetical protein